MDVAIINSSCANVASVAFAIERLGGRPVVTTDAARIEAAGRVILPGVGAAGTLMEQLRATGLSTLLPRLEQPVLGICLGMQIMFEASAEGDIDCLGILPGKAAALPGGNGLRVPHMGWNQLTLGQPQDPLLAGLSDGDYVYFVHGYYLPPGAETIAGSEYGTAIAAMVRRDNFWGCQFHPERSAGTGALILKNFLEMPC
jgi:glutamine amidotransferase